MTLTPRDEDILRILTHRLRLISIQQVARIWWTRAQPASAASRLRQLAAAGLVEAMTVMAHPEIELKAPILCWRPSDAEPDFGAASYRLKARWTKAPTATPLVFATREAMAMYGGYIGGRGPRPSEATHDIHLAQVYFRLMDAYPKLADRWVSENQQYAEGGGRDERLPDALIRGRPGSPPRIVEFGGAYSKAKLIEFHRGMSSFAYEVW